MSDKDNVKKKHFTSIDENTHTRVLTNKARMKMTVSEYIEYLMDKCGEPKL